MFCCCQHKSRRGCVRKKWRVHQRPRHGRVSVRSKPSIARAGDVGSKSWTHPQTLVLMPQACRIVQSDAAQGNRAIRRGDFDYHLAAGDQGKPTEGLVANITSFIDREQWAARAGLHMNRKVPHGFALFIQPRRACGRRRSRARRNPAGTSGR